MTKRTVFHQIWTAGVTAARTCLAWPQTTRRKPCPVAAIPGADPPPPPPAATAAVTAWAAAIPQKLGLSVRWWRKIRENL